MTGSIADVSDAAPTIDVPVVLHSGEATAMLHPAAGGRIGQIEVAGQRLLVDVPATDAHPTSWGSFPMAPWVGRIRRGQFEFDGTQHQLELNHVDGDGGTARTHSIHGTVFTRSWTIDEQSDTTIAMSCRLAGALDWPFGGSAHQHVELRADRLRCELWLDADDDVFPAEIGWHPWFRKPDRLDITPTAMYRRDEFGLPTGELVEPSAGPWDDCFVNVDAVRLTYDRVAAPTVTVAADCDHWVIFDEPTEATCVEPQSGPPDAFNLGAHLVTPSNPLRRTMTIAW
jgi:aldose 1-epimerase